MSEAVEPTTFEEAADVLAAAGANGSAIRFRGAGTKAGWGAAGPEPSYELGTGSLDRIVEHNAGDLTAVLEAGVPLARAQALFTKAGQMLAIDPPLGAGERATVGGVVATADSGPLRHHYGGARDLVIGMTVALSDGTVARSGGKVIKNVAGYDLAKLFTGSFGTLGMILAVNFRLHPRPPQRVTVLGVASDAGVLGSAARALTAAPLELDALDIAWRGRRGGLLAAVSGAEPAARANRAAKLMQEAGLSQVDVTDDDEQLWARQRAGQRSAHAALVRVAARPSLLPGVLRATDACGGTAIGRAGLGTSYLELDPESVPRLREELPASAHPVLLDAPAELRAAADPWGTRNGPALELMRRVKRRFDPAGVCNPGLFVGGI
jgi:glycolate oxidase FAD binding subunit